MTNSSPSFLQALRETGYLSTADQPVPGLMLPGDGNTIRLRTVFDNNEAGLQADALFSAQRSPISIFKDAGHCQPDRRQIHRWHELAWNVGIAPLLWVVTPTDVRLYNCYASPPATDSKQGDYGHLKKYALDQTEQIRDLDANCGRLATETGAFWSSSIGRRINRTHRVDQELLREIHALEKQLISLTLENSSSTSRALAQDLAQRFIGRCIFMWYLLDRGLARPFLPPDLSSDLGAMFATPETAFKLFDWLREHINGDLFPIKDAGIEREHLTPKHLTLLQDFSESRSMRPSQQGEGRLFRFRFDAIPIDLLSSIYQQFARSSAAEMAEDQSLHYTPIELVHLISDQVFEGLDSQARVVDPACGYGAFLVEAFRRLVWQETSDANFVPRDVVRRILYNQLYGIDINRSALDIATFSLYLAALELDSEAPQDISDLKFEPLINRTLFARNSLDNDVQEELMERQPKGRFDAVVGNAPWTFVGQSSSNLSANDLSNSPRPRRSPDQAFLRAADHLAGNVGNIGVIIKSTPIFSRDRQAIQSRKDLIQKMSPVALVNLSYFRREGLFPDALGPALIFFARCKFTPNPNQCLVGSIPWSPDFRRTGLFQINPGSLRVISRERVLSFPAILKSATFGTARDSWLIERLERSFPTLDEALNGLKILKGKHRGQGFKVGTHGLVESPRSYFNLDVVTAQNFAPFRMQSSQLQKFGHKFLERARQASIFSGPLLICLGAFSTKTAALCGRYSAAVITSNALYTESFVGVSFASLGPRLAYLLSGILNSSLTSFQFAMGGSNLCIERPIVKPQSLLALRVPPLSDLTRTCPELVEGVLEAERHAAGDPSDRKCLAALDEAVFELYGLEREERVLAEDSVERTCQLIFDSPVERLKAVRPPSDTLLRQYGRQVALTVNAYLRAQGKRHLEVNVFHESSQDDSLALGFPGLTAVRFVMESGGPAEDAVVRDGDPSDLARLKPMFDSASNANAEPTPCLNERRHLRLYVDDDLFVVKPSEHRNWTRIAALNDADAILADHWH